MLVSSKTFDDAGVYRLDRHRALVQTVDFFTPIVDDPFSYGQIAAANSLSDIYAMGGRPLTALNVIGFPDDLVTPRVVSAILRGGLAKAAEVGCVIIGGHSIRNPEPIYGLAVTGLVDSRRVTTNANARPGDALVLTKPLGTGIATTAIKRGMASRALQKNVIALMSQINTVGADLAESGLVRAATDITGYGLIGHLTDRTGHHFLADEPRRLAILALEHQTACFGKRFERLRVHWIVRSAGPECVFVQLQPLAIDATEHHRAEPPVADREGVCPPCGGLTIPET